MLLIRSQRLPEATLLSVKRIYLRPRRAGFLFLLLGALLKGSVLTKRCPEQALLLCLDVSGGEGQFLCSCAANPVVWWVVFLFSLVGQPFR